MTYGCDDDSIGYNSHAEGMTAEPNCGGGAKMAVILDPLIRTRDEDEKRRQQAIALIQSWRDGDDEELEEQCETWAYLQRALNENRLSERKRI